MTITNNDVTHTSTALPSERTISEQSNPNTLLSADTLPGTNTLLIGSDLNLSYDKHQVVQGVSIELKVGEVTALVGPNGSGKSTLLRSLARLHPIATGAAAIRNARDGSHTPINLLSARQFAREVTLFTQSRSAPQGLTVSEVVAFGRHPHRRNFGGLSPADRNAIEEAMRATGVLGMAQRAVGELSGGEVQRVWLAACVAQETGVVLLDEPTNHLDLRYQIETLDLVRDLADEHGVAVGIVLHDLDHASRIADHLILLANGQVHASGTPREVLTSENISEVYQIAVDVSVDPTTQNLRIDPVRRPRRPASL